MLKWFLIDFSCLSALLASQDCIQLNQYKLKSEIGKVSTIRALGLHSVYKAALTEERSGCMWGNGQRRVWAIFILFCTFLNLTHQITTCGFICGWVLLDVASPTKGLHNPVSAGASQPRRAITFFLSSIFVHFGCVVFYSFLEIKKNI